MSSGEEGCVSRFEVDFDGPGELIDVSGGFIVTVGSCCSHRRARSICNVTSINSSPCETSLLKGQIPVPLKPTLIVPGEAARCKEEMTIKRTPYIVIVWPGCLVTQALHAWFAYVLSRPQTDTCRG